MLQRNVFIGLPVLVCLSATLASGQPRTIKPGEVWPDNRGQHVQSHGGGIVKLKDTWYWFGEDRAQNLDRSKRYEIGRASCRERV